MNSIVVEGDERQRRLHIEEHIKKYAIPAYLTFTYPEKLKIAEVRAIKKQLSTRLPKGQRRVFIIEADISLEAQHALLKTLEELPEDTDIMLSVSHKDVLLPTILSRCKIVSFAVPSQGVNTDVEASLTNLFSATTLPSRIYHALQVTEKTGVSDVVEYEHLLHTVRGQLKDMLLSESPKAKEEITTMQQLLSGLLDHYSLVANNNLNKRMTLDLVLIEAITKLPIDKKK